MNLIQYSAVVYQIYLFALVSDGSNDCYQLVDRFTFSNYAFNVVISLLFLSTVFTYYVSYKYAIAAKQVNRIDSREYLTLN